MHRGMLVMAHRVGGSRAYRICKRVFDIAFSVCVIVVGLGPGLILSAFIARDTGGSPIYTQERVGMGGRTFRIYKFRTMVADSDDVEKYLNADQLAQWRLERKVDDDPRITPLGRKLRSTSVDEIPNFINVLKGDISIVGPRPALPSEAATYTDYQKQRLLVKPGITCYWQTRRNRDAITFDEWINLDLLYIKQSGVCADAKLILQTVGVVLTLQGS